jgi:trigger factor
VLADQPPEHRHHPRDHFLRIEDPRRDHLLARKGQQLPREPFEDQARSRVLLGLLVGELIRREGIKVDRERVRTKLDEVASAYPNADEVRRAYLQNPDALRQIETAVLEDQAIDWILARARVTDRPASFAEVTGFGRQA